MRNAWLFGLAAVVITAASAHNAAAQYAGYRPYGAYGSAYYNFNGGTVAGSYASGMGQLIQAQGAYNQMTAQALVPYEQAKSMELDNKLKAAQTQYQLQRINQQMRADEQRRIAAMYKSAPPPKIPRLTPSQLDPVTGKINWPAVLMQAAFEPQRSQLDALFATRAQNPSQVTYGQAQALAFAMRDKLDTMIKDVPTPEFFANRHFLESLAEEARLSSVDEVASSK